MKVFKTILSCCLGLSSVWLLWSCSTNPPDSFTKAPFNVDTASSNANRAFREPSGAEHVFTNANFIMWVPSRAEPIWDGHTSVVHVDETTPPGAFVKNYKIEVEVQINDRDWELKQLSRWASDDWYFQDHPDLSITNAQYGKQMRKDIWNPEKTRRLLINAMVFRSTTFDEDVETAKKMVESIKPISN
jgi:hypothetical protein